MIYQENVREVASLFICQDILFVCYFVLGSLTVAHKVTFDITFPLKCQLTVQGRDFCAERKFGFLVLLTCVSLLAYVNATWK